MDGLCSNSVIGTQLHSNTDFRRKRRISDDYQLLLSSLINLKCMSDASGAFTSMAGCVWKDDRVGVGADHILTSG